jgi:hypothetical protein
MARSATMSYVNPEALHRSCSKWISAWVVAYGLYCLIAVVRLSGLIQFSFSKGTLFLSYSLGVLVEPIASLLLAVVISATALAGRMWFRYPLYTLTAIVAGKWLYYCFYQTVLTFTSIPQDFRPLHFFMIFHNAGPTLALLVLSYMAHSLALSIESKEGDPRYPHTAGIVRMWRILGGVLLLAWIPYISSNFAFFVISLKGLRGHDIWFAFAYALLAVCYPLVYLSSILIAHRMMKASRDAQKILFVSNLPLLTIALAGFCWFLGGGLATRVSLRFC